MLFDQIAKKRPEGVTLFLFRQDPGNIARNRIWSSGTDFPVDSGELLLRQANLTFALRVHFRGSSQRIRFAFNAEIPETG